MLVRRRDTDAPRPAWRWPAEIDPLSKISVLVTTVTTATGNVYLVTESLLVTGIAGAAGAVVGVVLGWRHQRPRGERPGTSVELPTPRESAE